jgi:hypothetical protein
MEVDHIRLLRHGMELIGYQVKIQLTLRLQPLVLVSTIVLLPTTSMDHLVHRK